MGEIRCQQKGCTGVVEDGYCNVCGHAPVKAPTSSAVTSGTAAGSWSKPTTTGTGSSPISRVGKGTRHRGSSSSRTSRKQLGAGLLTLPDLPSADPEKMVMLNPVVPEGKRFCPSCDSPLRRESGFCGKCGRKYSFLPSLQPGDVVANQYEVKGALAYGGLGWIYLGFDSILSRYIVLKGLLNAHDASGAAAALAERKFLAAVKHPNIVGIHNFVQNGTEGYIVMEYVGGKTLKQIRQARGPLPPAEAIAYIHRVLPTFAYMHQLGLVYCDFKPDNLMMERDDVKLIDLGGVRRIDDTQGDIYGTVGYSAPEAGSGPTVASDLFTVGRTLAVLLTEIRGFSTEHRFTLPSPAEQPLFGSQESLYRFLLKSTAQSPEDRFESADQMTEQLLGILREIVAAETNTPRPGSSVYFGGDLLALESGDGGEPVKADHRHLALPSADTSDPAFQAVNNANALMQINKRIAALRAACEQVPKSREARLQLAANLAESGEAKEAGEILKALGDEDPWDWRVLWVSGVMSLASGNPADARKNFDQVYFDLPGELAPKLGLGLASELSGDLDVAIKMYELVSRTDPGFVSSVFGLARCLYAKGDRKAAVEAFDRVPPSSALYLQSRMDAARMLIRADRSKPAGADLARASALADGLAINGMTRSKLRTEILTASLNLLSSGGAKPESSLTIFGKPFEDKRLRLSLEESLRLMARLVNGEERTRLVDEANRVRPRTLF